MMTTDWNKQAARNNHDMQPHNEKDDVMEDKMIQMDIQEEVLQDIKKQNIRTKQ